MTKNPIISATMSIIRTLPAASDPSIMEDTELDLTICGFAHEGQITELWARDGEVEIHLSLAESEAARGILQRQLEQEDV